MSDDQEKLRHLRRVLDEALSLDSEISCLQGCDNYKQLGDKLSHDVFRLGREAAIQSRRERLEYLLIDMPSEKKPLPAE